uniref:Uncharacterized protein n=1 Tax=Rhizophora mucronata TaxID=61149 RepID=A0A2P2KIW5_RHIMU
MFACFVKLGFETVVCCACIQNSKRRLTLFPIHLEFFRLDIQNQISVAFCPSLA